MPESQDLGITRWVEGVLAANRNSLSDMKITPDIQKKIIQLESDQKPLNERMDEQKKIHKLKMEIIADTVISKQKAGTTLEFKLYEDSDWKVLIKSPNALKSILNSFDTNVNYQIKVISPDGKVEKNESLSCKKTELKSKMTEFLMTAANTNDPKKIQSMRDRLNAFNKNL